MGVAISELITKKEISFDELTGKVLVVDAPLWLYQFLSNIRSQDGTPLKDSKGRVTSHLAGLFFRTISLMKKNLKLVYVFDGKPPALKEGERKRRRELKEKAQRDYDDAREKHDIEAMEKYAKRTSKLDKEMIEEAKQLISALGLPVVQAPCEAEAQACHIVKTGDAHAVATQDMDTLMFGAPRIIRNLSIAGRRKRARKLSFETYKPEEILLADVVNRLGIDRDGLIVLCMLVGTDFKVGGIKGLGPKKSLGLVKKHDDYTELFKEVKWDEHFGFKWEEVFYLIKNMEVTDKYGLEWKEINANKVNEIMLNHDFSPERIETTLKNLKKERGTQKGLNEFF